MDTLILQIGAKTGRVRELVRSGGEPVNIGRGFDNRIVLTDPYVAPDQGSFLCEDGRWFFENNDDTNRVLLNNESLSTPRVELQAGDRLVLGRTVIQVYSADHEVAPTRKLLLSDWLHHDSIGWLVPLVALVVFNVLDFSVDYLLDTTREIEWKAHVIDMLLVNLILFGWVGIWAVNGKLVRHHYHFSQQLFISTIWLIGIVFVFPLLEYISFASDGATLSTVIAVLAFLAMVAWLARLNLYFSTSGRHATVIGIVISVVIVGGISATGFLSEEDFNPRAEAGNVLFPGFTLPGDGEPVDSYFDALEAELSAAEQDR